MKKLMVCLVACLALVGTALRAQDITGTWQGTLSPPTGKQLRIVLNVSKDDGRLAAVMYSIDQNSRPIKASSVTLDGSTFKYSVDLFGLSYEGKLSADGKSIAGTWSQGANPMPLELVRATKETAWEIPAPAPPPKMMAADADPSFEVATIKPNDSGVQRLGGLGMQGRNFKTNNSSLSDLISFAYDVQAKQIVGGPDWMDKDRYDIAAVMQPEGAPSLQQSKTMVQKFVTDRFALKFHHEKRELSAFVLTVAKNGPKLTPTQLSGPGPGFGERPAAGGLTIPVANATMGDFADFLQMLVLDRPVVDQTGLKGKFDFTLKFMPDDSDFNGHAPPLPKQTEDTETAPGLFEALEQQVGLKLSAEKTAVDVIAIDHVEKPSAN